MPSKSAKSMEADDEEANKLREEFAGLPLETLGREWLTSRSDVTAATKAAGGLRKRTKVIGTLLAERMIAERVETVSVGGDRVLRSKDVRVAK
jgi:hypothetical protein